MLSSKKFEQYRTISLNLLELNKHSFIWTNLLQNIDRRYIVYFWRRKKILESIASNNHNNNHFDYQIQTSICHDHSSKNTYWFQEVWWEVRWINAIMMLWDYIPQWVFFCYKFLHSCDQNVKWEYSRISLILKKKFTKIPLIPSFKSWLKWNSLALKNILHGWTMIILTNQVNTMVDLQYLGNSCNLQSSLIMHAIWFLSINKAYHTIKIYKNIYWHY